MDDLISRSEIISKIRSEGIRGSGYSNEEREDDVIDMIESIPSVRAIPIDWISDYVKSIKTIEHDEPFSEDAMNDSEYRIQIEKAGCIAAMVLKWCKEEK